MSKQARASSGRFKACRASPLLMRAGTLEGLRWRARSAYSIASLGRPSVAQDRREVEPGRHVVGLDPDRLLVALPLLVVAAERPQRDPSARQLPGIVLHLGRRVDLLPRHPPECPGQGEAELGERGEPPGRVLLQAVPDDLVDGLREPGVPPGDVGDERRGEVWACWRASFATVSPWKGGLVAIISYRTTPNE